MEYKKDINFKKVRYVKFDYTSGYNVSGIENAILGMSLLAKADLTKLDDISNLNAVEGVNDVNFTWNNPNMVGFTGVKIYKEDKLVATVDKNESAYKVDGLEANKNYNFKFVSVYAEGESVGIQKGVKTLIDPKTVPPGPVFSLTAEPTDKTVKLKWKSPKDDDLAGFKILQNGKQVS
ncbi:fibronectin type III domain-containing protein [Bacillus sp. TH13]|uniref:fibronectin type III domain-containing protein n=1 Tax=Bacillus sp. TH13 TaxID=2796379 RepID=UPI001F5B2EAF|nr:fibronectin type III domain-containing protein [Bacillus sp. TH13]